MKFFERFFSTGFTNLASSIQQKLPQFIQLTRINRPIGIFLLFWPTITSLWIASEGMPEFLLLIVFSLGTILMRSAGCCINDVKFVNLVETNLSKNFILSSVNEVQILYCELRKQKLIPNFTIIFKHLRILLYCLTIC